MEFRYIFEKNVYGYCFSVGISGKRCDSWDLFVWLLGQRGKKEIEVKF